MRTNTEDYTMLASVHAGSPKLVEWLKRRLESMDDIARKAREEVDVRWAQGRARELIELIEQLEGAADILRKADDKASK